MSIVVDKVDKYYGTQKALNGISFEVRSGEIVGFIGPNGAGKSSMMRIITGYLLADSGKVSVCGIDVSKSSLEAKRKIGYLPENNPLYLSMYVAEYLNYVAGLYQLKKNKDRVAEVIKMTGLLPESRKQIGQLSKGYRQRVGIAQALIHDPEVLILDEPTTGLDPNQIEEIRTLISDIGKKKTVMLSTHIMQEVEAICSKVIIVNNGEIIANDFTANIHRVGAKQVIEIEFGNNVRQELLKLINGVESVVELNERLFLIEASEDSDVRSRLFEWAVTNNNSILSMTRKEKKLQQLFSELTLKKNSK